MKLTTVKTKAYDPKKSIAKATATRAKTSESFKLSHGNRVFKWKTQMERVALVRQGIPFSSIETVGKMIGIPVNQILSVIDIPQTTYNKKKKENSLLDTRDSEFLLILTELIDFGYEVFNQEKEKFQRWLKKPNISLGGNTPASLLDTTTGINEVKKALIRIEYGNLA